MIEGKEMRILLTL